MKYSRFHKQGTLSVHSFNDDYLPIPERPGSYKYLFYEIPGSKSKNRIIQNPKVQICKVEMSRKYTRHLIIHKVISIITKNQKIAGNIAGYPLNNLLS